MKIYQELISKQNPHSRQRIRIVSIVFILMSAIMLWKGGISRPANSHQLMNSAGDTDVIATVNGEPIQRREFIAFLNQHHGDTTLPLATLKEKVLQELIRVKVIQIEGKKRGMLSSTAYADFLVDLDKENKRRIDAVANNQVIYGPQQYTEQTYYSDQFIKLVQGLKDDLAKHDFDISEGKLRELYEANKETYALKQDTIKLKEIVETTNSSEALERMQLVRNRIKNGESFDQIYEARMKDNDSAKEESINEANLRDIAKYRDTLYQAAMNLKVGEVSEIIADSGGYMLIQCVERQAEGYKALKDVSSEIKSTYINSQYDLLISQLEKQAEVKLNESYHQIDFP